MDYIRSDQGTSVIFIVSRFVVLRLGIISLNFKFITIRVLIIFVRPLIAERLK